MRPLATLLHAVNATLLILLWGGSLWAYSHLPEEIPMHYGMAGGADRFAATTMGRWLLLPVTGTLTAAITYGCAVLVASMPQYLNIPSRSMGTLSESGRQRVIRATQHMIYGIAALVLCLFAVMQAGNYAVAARSSTSLPPQVQVALWIVLLSILGLAFGHVIYLRRLVSRLE